MSLKGRETGLKVVEGKLGATVDKVRVVGREELTQAEICRDEHLLLVLQGASPLVKSPYVHMLWFPHDSDPPEGPTGGKACTEGDMRAFEELNISQRRVAMAMIADNEPLVIAHGTLRFPFSLRRL